MASTAAIDPAHKARLKVMCDTWKGDLLGNCVPFWLKSSLDTECGGFFTCLDEDGSVLDQAKYHWLQGRHVWMYARLYNSLSEADDGVTAAMRESWFSAAELGMSFLDKAKRDDGMLFFSTTREGEGLHYQRKPYTAVFYILAHLEFYQAIQTRKADGHACAHDGDALIAKAMALFEKFRTWIDNPELCGRPPAPTGAKRMSVLGEVMCLSGMCEEFIAKLPDQRGRFMPFVEDAMKRVVNHFDDERSIFMEVVDAEHGIDHSSMTGRAFNPGHSIEVAWFLLHLCDLSPNEALADMAITVLDGSLKIGWDTPEHNGGILYMMDILGKPMLDTTVTATHKLWWPHCEALYACVLAFRRTKDPKWLDWLEVVHKYIYDHFCDDKEGGGEWFGYLNRDGTVFNACKGGNYKGMYHVSRCLLYCFQVVEKMIE